MKKHKDVGNVYLVGGAIRDQLLGRPIKERDFVVVGATPKRLLEQGYRQVGRSFPVFLHPITHEEYALARTERKAGHGYHGFTCDFNPQVTLEEDLARRDLTINAMAMDNKGQIIDPFYGQLDIKRKILRHVSVAFMEDPVRVLRVARFMARYHHLGFSVAEDTLILIRNMALAGELNHLVPERVWQEWENSLTELNPEQFMQILYITGALPIIFPELAVLDLQQALACLQMAVKVTLSTEVRFAAFVFVLKERFPFLSEQLRLPLSYKTLAQKTIDWYDTVVALYTLTSEQIVNALEKMDAFRRPEMFELLLLTCLAISTVHLGVESQKIIKKWQHFQTECGKITAQYVMQQGAVGPDIKVQLHYCRVHCVRQLSEASL
jgi:tRNA nucleotidyltransferase (CCA-adding enzyme)